MSNVGITSINISYNFHICNRKYKIWYTQRAAQSWIIFGVEPRSGEIAQNEEIYNLKTT